MFHRVSREVPRQRALYGLIVLPSDAKKRRLLRHLAFHAPYLAHTSWAGYSTPVVRTIKRYANRKLYDTLQSWYVTLDEIAELVRQGEEVRIVDNTSREDLTAVTLAQILFEAEKRKRKSLPLSTLRHLIQSGGELLEKTIRQPVENIRTGTEKRVNAAISVKEDARDKLFQFVDSTTRAYDELQRRVDESLRSMTGAISQLNSPDGDLAQIRTRLDAIETRLARVESNLQTDDSMKQAN